MHLLVGHVSLAATSPCKSSHRRRETDAGAAQMVATVNPVTGAVGLLGGAANRSRLNAGHAGDIPHLLPVVGVFLMRALAD
ncbi:MAG: hypothetical protein NVS2B7_18490 [Herpetosiphon sp.]